MLTKESYIKYLYLLLTLFLVFIIYISSVFRGWIPFDENFIFDELLFPIPTSFSEISEIINNFALNSHLESTNTFFSNNLTIRSNPLDAVFNIITLYFFKTNAFLYHCFQIILHLFNTVLVWLILYNILKIVTVDQKNTLSTFNYFLISILTLFWGVHSASSEAILLITNNDAILTYTFCFLFILFEVRRFIKNIFEASFFHITLFASLFCITMLLTEYGYTLPLIIFFLLLSLLYKENHSVLQSFKQAFKLSLPYFLGLIISIVISLTRTHSLLENLTSSFTGVENYSPLYAFIERNLWLTPQIFIHLLKLLLFPVTLSIYQSSLTTITDTLINPYSIFSTLTYLTFLTLPIILFFILKGKKFSFILPLIYTFYFALFPFLHIILPTYCLSADRYCYFPAFFISLIVLIGILFILNLQNVKPKTILIPLACLVALISIRTFIRVNDWNNTEAL